MESPSKCLVLMLAAIAAAQNATQSIAPSYTLNGTALPNPTGFSSQFVLNVEDLWDLLIGPVEEAATTTTVEATSVPSSSLIPPPPLYYPSFPPGAQVTPTPKNESWSFPKDFWWGVAGASYQVEGAVKDGGRGPSVWDRLSHNVPNYVLNNATADITDNHYYLYKQDIARLAAMGVKAYSFSISWSRIMPFGKGPVNEEGIAHYDDLINTCIEYGLIPMATLYHWDTPLVLQDTYGGWLSENIVNDFEDYARLMYGRYGDRVKYWFTVNEPIVFCGFYPFPSHYFKNFSIPDIEQKFYCGQNVLLAHSQAYHLGKKMMPDSVISYKNGKPSIHPLLTRPNTDIKINGGYKIPLTDSADDAKAVQRAWDFNEGWFSDPIYLTGDYPSSVKDYVSDFLRPFTQAEKRAIKGSADIYAHDAYTSQFYFAPEGGVDACVNDDTNPLYPACADTGYTYEDGWLIGPAADPLTPWLHKATDWVPRFMRYIKDTWADPAGNLPIAITEMGFAEPFEGSKLILQDILTDTIRTSVFRDYMEAILISLSEGTQLIGVLAWSFVDNFEWASGPAAKFGLQYVNYSDPALPRYYKASFFEYKNAFDVYQEK